MASSPDSKRVKTSNDAAPYELIYWPGVPGRGEFVRMLFEETGTPFSDLANDAAAARDTVIGLMSGPGDAVNPPKLACPTLKHGDLLLSQTANILLYLAPKLGLAPAGDGGHVIFHLNEMTMTFLDLLSSETHDTHHPVGTSLYYEDQVPEAKRRSKDFKEMRLPKALAYVQRILDSKISGDGPWLYGDSLTYPDLVFFQGLHGTTHAFPKTVEKLRQSGEYKGAFKLYEAVQERPNIKKYMASDRRRAYGSGIYRHYPELEEDD